MRFGRLRRAPIRAFLAQPAIFSLLVSMTTVGRAHAAGAGTGLERGNSQRHALGDRTDVVSAATTTTLTNGAGDGSVSVDVDCFGAFGSLNGLPATYDSTLPSVGVGQTTDESAVYFSALDGFLASTGTMNGPDPNPTPVMFTTTTATTATSAFSTSGFNFTLNQSLGAVTTTGSTLTQTYTVTNTLPTPQPITLVRVLNSALAFDGSLTDAGRTSADGTILTAVDASGSLDPKVAVEIGAGDAAVFSIQPVLVNIAGVSVRYTDAIRSNNGIGPGFTVNLVAGDTNSDNVTDVDYDLTLWLQQGTTLKNGQSFTFTTTTHFTDRSLVTSDVSVSISDSPDPVAIVDGDEIQTITYTIDVRNAGPDTANSVVLTDTLDSGTTFRSASGTGVVTPPPAGPGGTVTITIGSIGPDKLLTILVFADVTTVVPKLLTNTATVTISGGDPMPGNNVDTETTVASEPRPDLSITMFQTRDPIAQDSIQEYQMLIRNPGLGSARDVVVTLNVPAGTQFAYALSTVGGWVPGPAGSILVPLGKIRQSRPDLNTDLVVVFGVSVTATAGATITNTATVTTSSIDPDLSNNTDTISAPVVLGAGRADLELGYTQSPNPVLVGHHLTYTLRVKNLGPDTATDVVVVDVSPIGTRVESVETTQGTVERPTGGFGPVVANIGTMLPDARDIAAVYVTIVLEVLPTAPANLSSIATVSGTERDLNASNNRVLKLTQVQGGGGTDTPYADLAVSVTADQDTFSETGLATFTFTVRNLGPDTAELTTFVMVVPIGTTFISSTTSLGTCTGPEGFPPVISCQFGPLGSGATVTLTLTVRVNTAAGGTVEATGSATSNAIDPNQSNNSAKITRSVTQISPPIITRVFSTNSRSKPFRLKIVGFNFKNGAHIEIGGTPWDNIRVVSEELIVVRGGRVLQDFFPRGQQITIEVFNPDGSSDTITFGRPSKP